ncbi:hypothetical protein SEVIR_7G250800v4 [Setaria viridis]|uniref:Uncharacterized protein n=1 Tax=Setaria viridis TaxID=4556 RepID=A0A4U6U8N7_SETVI|nr:hypothetical protein SEVIR_7G250800v2 [Setaria viridis]
MHPGRNGHGRRRGRGAADAAGFIVTGFAAVFTAVSYLLTVIVGTGMGDNDAGGSGAVVVFTPGTQWQLILAFAVMSAGLLLIMNGMRFRDARPPIFVRRVVDAAAAVLWNGGGPERLLPVLIILVCSVLEAWFDFF